jgi:indole-3-glycerol phosphate synthase
VRYLDDALLAELLAETRALGMDALVEAHTAEEIARAVKVGADIIGVNCRDLETLSVDLAVSERLLGEIPEGIVRVAESGVRTRADIERLAAAGADAFLFQKVQLLVQVPSELFQQVLVGKHGKQGRRHAQVQGAGHALLLQAPEHLD